MTGSNDCGECGMCCKLLAVEELGKAAGRECDHFARGCAIYRDRPHSCRGFHCLWLKSERLTPEARLGREWRPDRAKFVMYTERGGMRLNVVVEPSSPLAWKREPYYSFFKRMSARAAEGHELVVCVADRWTVVFPQEDVELGRAGPEHQLVVGRTERDGRQVHYAVLRRDPPKSIATGDFDL